MGLKLEKPIKSDRLYGIDEHEIRCSCGTYFLVKDKSIIKPRCPKCGEIIK